DSCSPRGSRRAGSNAAHRFPLSPRERDGVRGKPAPGSPPLRPAPSIPLLARPCRNAARHRRRWCPRARPPAVRAGRTLRRGPPEPTRRPGTRKRKPRAARRPGGAGGATPADSTTVAAASPCARLPPRSPASRRHGRGRSFRFPGCGREEGRARYWKDASAARTWEINLWRNKGVSQGDTSDPAPTESHSLRRSCCPLADFVIDPAGDREPLDPAADLLDREGQVLRHPEENDVVVALRQQGREEVGEPSHDALAARLDPDVAQLKGSRRRIHEEVGLSLGLADLAEDALLRAPLLGLHLEIEKDAGLAAGSEAARLDLDVDLLDDGGVLQPARAEDFQSRL